MPKHYCDYCDVFLTHDSASVRKAHNSGRNHLANVRDYYASLGHDKAQSIIDQITAAYETGGTAPPSGPQSHFSPFFPPPPFPLPTMPPSNGPYGPLPFSFPPSGGPPFPPLNGGPPFPPNGGPLFPPPNGASLFPQNGTDRPPAPPVPSGPGSKNNIHRGE